MRAGVLGPLNGNPVAQEDDMLISVSKAAVERIRQSAAESKMETPVLRVAAQLGDDGSVQFGMGFDQARPGDTTVETEGVFVVVAERSRELVDGTHLDFVEVEPGDFRFIFVAPGDGASE